MSIHGKHRLCCKRPPCTIRMMRVKMMRAQRSDAFIKIFMAVPEPELCSPCNLVFVRGVRACGIEPPGVKWTERERCYVDLHHFQMWVSAWMARTQCSARKPWPGEATSRRDIPFLVQMEKRDCQGGIRHVDAMKICASCNHVRLSAFPYRVKEAHVPFGKKKS